MLLKIDKIIYLIYEDLLLYMYYFILIIINYI